MLEQEDGSPKVVNIVQQNLTGHLEPYLRQLVGAGSVDTYAGDPRGCGCTGGDIELTECGACMDAVELARGRSHAPHGHGMTRRLTEQYTGLGTRLWRYIFFTFLLYSLEPMFVDVSAVSPRWATTAISQLLDNT